MVPDITPHLCSCSGAGPIQVGHLFLYQFCFVFFLSPLFLLPPSVFFISCRCVLLVWQLGVSTHVQAVASSPDDDGFRRPKPATSKEICRAICCSSRHLPRGLCARQLVCGVWCVAHTLLGGGRVGGRKRGWGVVVVEGGVGWGGRDVILEALHKRDRSLP